MTVTGNTGTTEKQWFARKIGPWLLRLAVASIFVSSGLEKFGVGPGQEWIRMFAKIGLGDWFRYLTGAIVCHLFVLGDPVSSIINVALIAAILAAGRQPKPEDEGFTKLDLH